MSATERSQPAAYCPVCNLGIDTFPYQFQPSAEPGCYEVYFDGLYLGRFTADGKWRAVCGKQMLEAAQEIERLQEIVQDAEIRLDERRKIIEELEGRLKQQSSE